MRESTRGIHPSIETQGRRHLESKNNGISGPTKERTCIPQKLKRIISQYLHCFFLRICLAFFSFSVCLYLIYVIWKGYQYYAALPCEGSHFGTWRKRVLLAFG